VAPEPSSLASVAFGLASATTWGAGDFSGGLASRGASTHGVVVLGQGIGLVLLLALAVAGGEAFPGAPAVGWGALAGVAGAAGLLALYGALAAGPMGIAAPVSGVVGAILPVLVGGVVHGPPGTVRLLGFALAGLAVWLLAGRGTSAAATRLADLRLPILSGVSFGLFFVLMHRAGDSAVLWPLVVARGASTALLGAMAGGPGRLRWPRGGGLVLAALAGVLDAAGNAFFVLAARTGRLDVAAVLASLYPGSTVLLACAVLRERLSRRQAAGVLAALAAIACVAG
jgi:drug/metabolite transporter (DMT)-like permease